MANVFNFPVESGRIVVPAAREAHAPLSPNPAEKVIHAAERIDVAEAGDARTELAPCSGVTRHATVRAYDFCPDEFAAACREAALAFMNGVADGWGKHDLAMWLVTSYRPLAAIDAGRPSLSRVARSEPALDACSVSLVMEAARAEVAARLFELREGDWTSVTAAMQAHHVEPVRSSGELSWVPVHRARMRLADRVLSLFLVDYLHCADAYEVELAVCGGCAQVSFGRSSCGGCARPVRSYLRELAGVDALSSSGRS